MFPRTTLDNALYGALADAESAGHRSEGLSRGDQGPNSSHLVVVQFGGRRQGAMSQASAPSSFSGHVSDVVGLRTEEEVSRVDARRVITTVQDAQPFGDRTDVHFVGQAMGQVLTPVHHQYTVPITVSDACPSPTFGVIRQGDLTEQAVTDDVRRDGLRSVTGGATETATALLRDRGADGERLVAQHAVVRDKLTAHRKAHPFGVMPPAVRSGAGVLCCPNSTTDGGFKPSERG